MALVDRNEVPKLDSNLFINLSHQYVQACNLFLRLLIS